MSQESAYFIAENVSGRHGFVEIKRQLDALHGVQSVSLNAQNHLVAVHYDSAGISYDKIEHCLNSLGYQIAADASRITTR